MGNQHGKILQITGYAGQYGYETNIMLEKFSRIVMTYSLFIIT